MQFYLYAAGPLGFSEAGRHFHNGVMLPMYRSVGFTVLDPWMLTDQSVIDRALKAVEGREQRLAWTAVNKIIFENNYNAIEQCHAIGAELDGVDVDSGTAGEVAHGCLSGKIVQGYRSDFRLSSDNCGSKVNLQIEGYIYRSGGRIATTIEAFRRNLCATLEELARKRRGRAI